MIGRGIGRGEEGSAARLRAFSDGVFSIVLTVLVLSLAIPAGRVKTDTELLTLLEPLLPKFIGYVISFVLVGVFWMLHVGIDRAIRGADRPTLAANLVSLFPITTLPFTTDLLTRSLLGRLAWAFYAGNIAFAALGTILLWNVVVRRGFADPEIGRGPFRFIPLRSGILAAAFLLSIPVTYAHPILGRYVTILVPISYRLLRRRFAVEQPVESERV